MSAELGQTPTDEHPKDPVELALAPLDWVRGGLLRRFRRVVRPFVVDRDLRVALFGSVLVSLGLISTLFAPFWLLALGPILLGVPHVMADIRYLVVQPGFHRQRLMWVCAGIPLAVAAIDGGVGLGLVGALGALCIVPGPAWRRLVGATVLGALAAAAFRAGWIADLVFAHAHNFIAVALWWAWRPRTGKMHFIPLTLFVLASVVLLVVPIASLTGVSGSMFLAPAGLDLGYFASTLAPGARPELALRLVLLFAFAQSVHYTIWLRLVPEEARPQRTPRTFVRTYRALVEDFGRPMLVIFAVVATAVAIWATVDLAQARSGYLRMAIFHGHIELVAAALLWMRVGAPERAA
ncbi:MAG: hypothetical protein KC561_04000 [Myxococcales bacterium]|nr:hypothetical protein [Myxococcales bacterium]